MRCIWSLLVALVSGAVSLAADPVEGWGLRPVKRPAPPEPNAAGKAWAKTDIDRFIWAKLTDKGLAPSPAADPRALVRRVYFDLIGLPPPPEVVEAFAKNPTDDAYTRIVDDLLASPHHGERWARHWLDIARYGESDGFERNAPRTTAWHYRDWVIRSLNGDLPYDRFAKMQLAGDALTPGEPDGVKATGFLVAGIHNTVLGSNKVMQDTARQDELEDVIGTVGQTFLGLTVQCARCHDHKFDPVTQVDYYRLAAALGGVTHGERPAMSAKVEATRKALAAEADDLSGKLAALEAAVRVRVREKWAAAKKPAAVIEPLARWSFAKDASDESGKLNGELLAGAKVERGRLILDGKGFVRTTPLAADLTAKTLEVWAVVPDLTQRGGGLIVVETSTGGGVRRGRVRRTTTEEVGGREQQLPPHVRGGGRGRDRDRPTGTCRHRVRRRRVDHTVPRRSAVWRDVHAERLRTAAVRGG